MSDPIEILMSEHRIIEKALTALERACSRASAVPTHDPLLVESLHHHT